MKKAILFFIYFGLANLCLAQNPTYQQKLYYTCKIWGFVKYYHSEVSNCSVNWDSVLVADLPLIKNAVTQNDFNDALDTMLNAAGPMAIATTNAPPPLPPELRRNLDFTWINDPLLRNDVQVILDTIKNNFRPHTICWEQAPHFGGSWLYLPYDNLMDSTNVSTNYPDEWHRGLMLFKYWNLIRYFNPHNYVCDRSIDSTLFDYDSLIVTAPAPSAFFLGIKMMSANLNDLSVAGVTWSNTLNSPDQYVYGPQLILKYFSGKYVAVKSLIPIISVGDEIISVDGLSGSQWEDSLRPYISAGNNAVFRKEVARNMLLGIQSSTTTIVSQDSLGNNHTFTGTRSLNIYSGWYQACYPNDTLAAATWKHWDCNVGYVNMAKMQSGDVNPMYTDLQNTSAIIFDLRNYANGVATASAIAHEMYPQMMTFCDITEPDATYPGTFFWFHSFIYGGTTPYQGKVILLINEQTQSTAEYACMMFDAMPDVVNVGSQTAGAAGDMTVFNLSPDIYAGFTSVGFYYPNGDSTERIGIVPDSLVNRTQIGTRHHRDEVLEKAMEIAGCWLPVENIPNENPTLMVYPNPSNDVVHVELNNVNTGKIIYTITDVTGRIVLQKEMDANQKNVFTELDIHSLSAGMYVLSVKTETQQFTEKLMKE